MHGAEVTTEEHDQLTRSWQRESPLPAGDPGRLMLALTSLRALREVRRQVRAFLDDSLADLDPAQREDVAERAVLVIDELTSNAVRHAGPPSSVQIVDHARSWTIAVTDSAPTRLPVPARDRPAGAGGYGLYLIAQLTVAHGVHYDAAVKTVWATVAKTS